MLASRILPLAMCAVLMSACSAPPVQPAAPAVVSIPSLESLLHDAEAAFKSSQDVTGRSSLQRAATLYPADKQSWLMLAQNSFDRGNYGVAISDAEQVLQRDSENKLAHSIAAVSGLRVASASLAELSVRNNLSGNVRTEAQELAKLLRTSLGEDVLVPRPNSHVTAAAAAKSRTPSRPANDPFANLK